MAADGPVGLVLDREGGVDDLRVFAADVVVQHPCQAFVQVRVDALDVVQADGLVQEHLVKGHGEPPVDVVAVEDGHPDDAPHEVEVGQVVRVYRAVRIDLKSVNVLPVSTQKMIDQ